MTEEAKTMEEIRIKATWTLEMAEEVNRLQHRDYEIELRIALNTVYYVLPLLKGV